MIENLVKLLTATGRAHPRLRWPILALMALLYGLDALLSAARQIAVEAGTHLRETGKALADGARRLFRLCGETLLPLAMARGRVAFHATRQWALSHIHMMHTHGGKAVNALRAELPELRRHAPRRAMAAGLTLCMLLTLLPVSAFAAGESGGAPIDTADDTYTELTALEGAPAAEQAAMEGALDALDLPETLSGIYSIRTDTEIVEPGGGDVYGTVEIPTAWDGLPDPAVKGEYTLTAALTLPEGCVLVGGVEAPTVALTLTPDRLVEAARELLAALPALEEVTAAMTAEDADFDQLDLWAAQAQEASDACDALTDAQRKLIPDAQNTLDALMAAFRGGAVTLEGSTYVFSKGSGTAADPWQVADAEDLAGLANAAAGTYYVLKADIALSGEWTPISGFCGALDGNGYIISGLNVTTTDKTYAGLFGLLDRGSTQGSENILTIRNLVVRGKVTASSSTGSVYAGGIAGYMNRYVLVENCAFLGDVTAESTFVGTGEYDRASVCAGGVIGRVNSYTDDWVDSLATNCYAVGDITATAAPGGVKGNLAMAGGVMGFAGDMGMSGEANYCLASSAATVRAGYSGSLVTATTPHVEVNVDPGTPATAAAQVAVTYGERALGAAVFTSASDGTLLTSLNEHRDSNLEWVNDTERNDGYPVPVTPPEAKWGADASSLNTGGTFADALAAKPAYLQLGMDLTLAAPVTLDWLTTLDLNGQTLTYAPDLSGANRYASMFSVTSTVTLIDGGSGQILFQPTGKTSDDLDVSVFHVTGSGGMTVASGDVFLDAANLVVGTHNVFDGTGYTEMPYSLKLYPVWLDGSSGGFTMTGGKLRAVGDADDEADPTGLCSGSSGPVTLSGGSISGGRYGVEHSGSGTLTISGTASISSESSGLYLSGSGTGHQMTGGIVSTTGGSGSAIWISSGGDLTVSGGVIKSETGTGIEADGELTLSDSTVIQAKTDVTLTVGKPLKLTAALQSALDLEMTYAKGGDTVVQSDGIYTITADDLAKLTCTDGWNPVDLVLDGTGTSAVIKVASPPEAEWKDPTSSKKLQGTFDEGWTALNNSDYGGSITLLRDVSLPKEYAVAGDRSISVELESYTLTTARFFSVPSGDLRIRGGAGGKLVNSGGYAPISGSGGDIYLNGGTVEGVGQQAVYLGSGSGTLSVGYDAIVTSDATDGTISAASGYIIKVWDEATVKNTGVRDGYANCAVNLSSADAKLYLHSAPTLTCGSGSAAYTIRANAPGSVIANDGDGPLNYSYYTGTAPISVRCNWAEQKAGDVAVTGVKNETVAKTFTLLNVSDGLKQMLPDAYPGDITVGTPASVGAAPAPEFYHGADKQYVRTGGASFYHTNEYSGKQTYILYSAATGAGKPDGISVTSSSNKNRFTVTGVTERTELWVSVTDGLAGLTESERVKITVYPAYDKAESGEVVVTTPQELADYLNYCEPGSAAVSGDTVTMSRNIQLLHDLLVGYESPNTDFVGTWNLNGKTISHSSGGSGTQAVLLAGTGSKLTLTGGTLCTYNQMAALWVNGGEAVVRDMTLRGVVGALQCFGGKTDLTNVKIEVTDIGQGAILNSFDGKNTFALVVVDYSAHEASVSPAEVAFHSGTVTNAFTDGKTYYDYGTAFPLSQCIAKGSSSIPEESTQSVNGSGDPYEVCTQTITVGVGTLPDGSLSAPLSQEMVDAAFGAGNAALNPDGSITINKDVALDKTIEIKTDVTIDLGGHTVTGPAGAEGGDGKPVFDVAEDKTATVKGPGTAIGGAGGSASSDDSNGGDGGNGVSGAGNLVVAGAAITGGAGGGSANGYGGYGGDGVELDGKLTVKSGGVLTGGAGGNSGSSLAADGGHGADVSYLQTEPGSSLTGGAGGSGGKGGAGGNGVDGPLLGGGSASIGGTITGGKGGTGSSGDGGYGGGGIVTSGDPAIQMDIKAGAQVTGGAGGDSTYASGSGGLGGTGIVTGAGSISGSVTGGTGGTGTGGNAAGGTGVENKGSGAVTVNPGGSVAGGAGGSGNQRKGGFGGEGVDSSDAGTVVVNGSVTGGNGGDGEGTGDGGDGSVGVREDDPIGGSGTIAGGNGGNIPESGSGSGGSGGAAITGGGSFGGTSISGGKGVKATATVESKPGAPTVEVPKQELVDAAVTDGERNDADITSIDVKLTIEKKDAPTDAGAAESAKPAGTEIGLYLDVKLEKTITKTSGASTETVTDAEKLLTITITLPEALRGGSNYAIVRVHNDSGEALSTVYDGASHTLSAQTDKFSTYAIAYTPAGGTVDPPVDPPVNPPVTPDDSDSGGGSPSYKPAVTKPEHGSVTVTPAYPSKGDKVTVTTKPDAGYVVDRITVTDKDGKTVAVTEGKDGKYIFTQPSGKVTIAVTYKPESQDTQLPFNDVNEGDWFYESVKYVYETGLMAGTASDTFSPYQDTSRGMIVTILWRLEGAPEAGAASSFPDVAADAYCAKAVAWGAENGIHIATPTRK